jgi:hypothetical protein
MHPRTLHGPAALLRLAPLAVAASLAAGCGHPAPAGPAKAAAAAPRAIACGTAKTPANVPVKVEITKGSVTCATALAVEHAYTAAVAAGKAPGNGGGGPVNISGWQCEGFTTPVMLQTGDVSKCLRDGSEILTLLPPPPAN